MSEGTKIAIVGAGRVGSTLACTLAASGLARRMAENFCRLTAMSCHAQDMAAIEARVCNAAYEIIRTVIPVPLSDRETISLVNSAAAIRALIPNDVGSPKE
jgi:glycerol-3-phosphate dehydrogenase